MAASDKRHHGPLTLFEREYEKHIRAGMPAYRAALAAMQAAPAQHSAPSFDWQTLPPPPMATLDGPPPVPMERPKGLSGKPSRFNPSLLPLSAKPQFPAQMQPPMITPPVGMGRPDMAAPNSFPPRAPMPLQRPNFPSPPPAPIAAPPPLQAPPAAAAPTLARLPNGKMIAEGTYPSANEGNSFTVKRGPDGNAVITPSRSGFINPAKMGPGTIGGGFIQRAIKDAAPQVAANVGTAANNLGSAASDLAASSGSALEDLKNNPTIQSLGDTLKGANPFGGLAGMFGGGTPQAPSVASSFPGRPSVTAPNSPAAPPVRVSTINPDGSQAGGGLTTRKVNTVPVASDGTVAASGNGPGQFGEFYSGAMLAPNRVGGKLIPAPIYGQSSSVADLYKGMYPPQAQQSAALPAPAPLKAPTTVDAANPVNIDRLGLTSDPFVTPPVQAIEAATSNPTAPAYNPGTWGSAPMFRAPPLPPQYQPPATIPLTSLGTVNPMTQVGPYVESGFNQTPAGHIKQYLAGDLVQGGILKYLPRLPAYPTHYTAQNPPPLGPGQNGSAGQGTIYNNPQKYGATAAERQAHAAARIALMGG